MNTTAKQAVFGISLSFFFNIGFCLEPDIETGDFGMDCATTDYTDPQTIANLRRLGLEPVTAPEYSVTPSDGLDDTGGIQNAIFRTMEQCMNAAVPPGADNRTYIDGCKAVFFPPGEYHVSDTIKVMQPLLPADDLMTGKLKVLTLGLDANGVVEYMGKTNPVLDEDFRESNAGTGVDARRKSNVLIGSRCEWNNDGIVTKRPVIKASAFFNAPACPGGAVDPKPVVQFWAQCRDGASACKLGPIGSTDPAHGQSNVLFNNIFRNIDIDAGNGIEEVIGIDFPGAQGSAIEDSDIIMTNGAVDGLIGINNMPGQSGGIYNVKVTGGQYGLSTNSDTRYGMAVGLRLFNQTESAIKHDANNKLTVVGFHIKGAGAAFAAVDVSAGPWSGVAMVDGVIDGGGSSSPAIKVDNRPIYIKNTQINGAGTNIVTTGTTVNLSPIGAWTSVNEWAYSSKIASSGEPKWMIDGVVGENGITGEVKENNVTSGSAPGTDAFIKNSFVDIHLWDQDDLPSFEDPTSRVVLAQIYDQNVPLSSHIVTINGFPNDLVEQPRIFLGGGGRHPINETLVLNKYFWVLDRKIAGLDRVHTVIESQSNFDRSNSDPAEYWCPNSVNPTPMIKATGVDSASSFGRVSLAEHRDCTSFIPVDWQAGEDSSMHAVMITRSDAVPDVTTKTDANQVGFQFSGNGGGRHWGLQPEGGQIESQTGNASYRHLKVGGTSELLNIYGFNCEKVSGGTFACELNDAKNVDLYNVKAETCAQCPAAQGRKTANQILLLNKTENVNFIGYGGNARPGEPAPSTNTLAAIVISDGATKGLTLALINPNTSLSTPELGTSGSWATIRNNISSTDISGARIGSYVEEDK